MTLKSRIAAVERRAAAADPEPAGYDVCRHIEETADAIFEGRPLPPQPRYGPRSAEDEARWAAKLAELAPAIEAAAATELAEVESSRETQGDTPCDI